MKILITGANGFVGGRLLKFLKKMGYHVRGSVRKDLNSFKNINNKKNKKKIDQLFRGIDIIINCIGSDSNSSLNYKKIEYVNSILPKKILLAADKAKVRYFIYLSTFHVYDFKSSSFINENSKTKITNFYNKSKITGEKRILNIKKNLKLIVIRPCNLFGYPIKKNKNCWKLLINSLVKQIVNNKKIKISSEIDSSRTFSSLESFNEFIFFFLKKIQIIKFKNKNFIINYTSNYNLKISEVIKIVLDFFDKKNNLIFFKHKKLAPSLKKVKYLSLYQRKIKNINDNHFFSELKKLSRYIKQNK